MSENDIPIKPEGVDEALSEMKIEETTSSAPGDQLVEQGQEPQPQRQPSPADLKDTLPQYDGSNSQRPTRSSRSQTPLEMKRRSQTPTLKSEEQSPTEVIDGDISITQEPNKPAKLSRKATQKFTPREPPLFNDYEDSTDEATSKFQVIRDCIYGSKYMGSADHDALGCDCNEEFRDGFNHACGEDSDCINRLTKIECLDDECRCGPDCQNQRFQKKQFAKVSVIKTEKKGYGLRADTDLHANDFIFEYIGEVINEPTFRRRTIQYDEEGIKHFYFMSLTKSEFVDATKKGNLGRFCNHSCNPNSYVDKWVVGDKLRMGIFAERDIKAGEELVFNYNVDRYGADPTPCYCGEPNCTGFLGGKTQTERATKLSHTTIEALGIDDGDGWDLAVAKKPRKKKTGEDDEEYVSNVQPKPLDHKGIAALMGTLMQCKEKWIVVKLLDRIIKAGDEKIYQKVVQFHGYTILRSAIGMWEEDNNVILQILDILYKLPRVSKNKIVDSKIEPSIQKLTTSEHEDIAFEAKRLLEDWSKLELAYRIPRKKFDADAAAANLEMMKTIDPAGYESMMNQYAVRRDAPVENKVSTPSTPNPVLNAPTGPRGTIPQRGPVRMIPPILMRRSPLPLPSGWYPAKDTAGRVYYYSKAGAVTWQRPTLAAYQEPVFRPTGMTKAQLDQKSLQAIIDSITKEEAKPLAAPSPRPESESPSMARKKEEKWRSLPVQKQMKIYETTLAPTVQYVMNKYTKKLPKEDLKRHAKDISKKMVASDYKRGRVEDPTYIDRNKEKQVKAYVAEFFDKAVKKRREHEKKKNEKAAKASKMDGVRDGDDNTPVDTPVPTPSNGNAEEDDDEEVTMDMSDDEDGEADATMRTGGSDDTDESRKRKHGEEHGVGDDAEAKRVKDANGHVESPMDTPPPPPPPPPPPQEFRGDTPLQDLPSIEQEMQELPPIELEMQMSLQGTPEEVQESEESRELRLQQEALERENEEAAAEEAQAPAMNTQIPLMEIQPSYPQ